MVPAGPGGAVAPGSASPLAPIAQPTSSQAVQQNQKFAPGSLLMTLDMIANQESFGHLFAAGGAHSILAHGGALHVHGAYHKEVVQAMKSSGWALVAGTASAPPSDANLEQWGDALVRRAAQELLDANEVT